MLLGLDLDDPEAICQFVNRYGALRTDWLREEGCFDWVEGQLRPGVFETLRSARPFPEPLRWELMLEPCEGGVPADWFFGETLEDFRFGASCLILLAQTWRFLRGQIRASEVRCRLPLVFRDFNSVGDELQVVEREFSVPAAEYILCEGLNAALRTFTPRLLSQSLLPPGSSSLNEGVTTRRTLQEPSDSVYALCALELFNLIVRSADLRECANETCGELFIPHADFGRHCDSIYHSPRCKNTQWKRDSRRLKRSPR